MFEQINSQFVSLTKQFAESAIKANTLALQNFEHAMGVQLKTFEAGMTSTVAFMGEAVEVRDLEGVKAIFPKGVQLVKSSSEQFYNAGQEVLGQSLKTGEAIGQLYKAQFDAANDNVRTNVNAAAATVQATAKPSRR
jgi:translation elongation factor EF-Ts